MSSASIRVDRIDFTDFDICDYCHRKLKLGIAWVVVEDDKERPAGPHCARKQADTHGIPDFTKGAHYSECEVAPDEPVLGKRTHANNRITTQPDSAKNDERANLQAICYLRLRQEKMSDFAVDAIRYSKLDEAYERYKRGSMTEDDFTFIKRLIHFTAQNRPLLSFESLQTAYAYHKILLRAAAAIENAENRIFLESLIKYLLKNGMLTTQQIEGANQWLKNYGKVRLRQCKYWTR